MDLQNLLANPPPLHRDAQGGPTIWGLSEFMLNVIDRSVTRGSVTLETGAGLSTILFAAKAARHTCVVPDEGLVKRILDYCATESICTDDVRFTLARSEDALPTLDVEPLDLLLIDGRHAFPSPFIDWYYGTRALKPGGRVIVDDIHLWTGDLLRSFLLEEPGWRLETEDPFRSSVFVMERAGSHDRWWFEQPTMLRMNRHLRRLRPWRKLKRRMRNRVQDHHI